MQSLPGRPRPSLCSILFPTLEILPLEVVWDPQRLCCAMEVEGVMRLRLLGLRVPVLAQFFVELAPRREHGGDGGLQIAWWSEHYSLRTLAKMLPGRLGWLADWAARRAVAVGSERLVRLLARWGLVQWAQQHGV